MWLANRGLVSPVLVVRTSRVVCLQSVQLIAILSLIMSCIAMILVPLSVWVAVAAQVWMRLFAFSSILLKHWSMIMTRLARLSRRSILSVGALVAPVGLLLLEQCLWPFLCRWQVQMPRCVAWPVVCIRLRKVMVPLLSLVNVSRVTKWSPPLLHLLTVAFWTAWQLLMSIFFARGAFRKIAHYKLG